MHPTYDGARTGPLAGAQAGAEGGAQAGANCSAGADSLDSTGADEPAILEEIEVEDLAVDGICGVY